MSADDSDGIENIRRAFGGSSPQPKKNIGKKNPRQSPPQGTQDHLPALLSHPSFYGGITAAQESALLWQAKDDAAVVIEALRIPEALIGSWPLTVHAVRQVLRCDVFRAKVVIEYLNGTLFTSIHRKDKDHGNA